MIAVYDDDDLSVYRVTTTQVSRKDADGNDILVEISESEKMDETEFWDEFIQPENGEIFGKILFDQTWDEEVCQCNNDAVAMNLSKPINEHPPEGFVSR